MEGRLPRSRTPQAALQEFLDSGNFDAHRPFLMKTLSELKSGKELNLKSSQMLAEITTTSPDFWLNMQRGI